MSASAAAQLAFAAPHPPFPAPIPLVLVFRLADFVLPEALRVRGYDAGLEEEEADLEAQFSDDEAVRGAGVGSREGAERRPLAHSIKGRKLSWY